MTFADSALSFIAGFSSWFWPLLLLIFVHFIFRRLRPGSRSGRDRDDSVARTRHWWTAVVVVGATLAAIGAYHDLRIERDAEIARLELELFRVGVVRSERLEYVEPGTWQAKNEIGKIISFSLNGLSIPLADGRFKIQGSRISLPEQAVPRDNLSPQSEVELVYMARHSGRQ